MDVRLPKIRVTGGDKPQTSSNDITSTTDIEKASMSPMMSVSTESSTWPPQNRKRPAEHDQYGAPINKRPAPCIRLQAGYKWNLQALTNVANLVESGNKSPVSALNELGVKVKYVLLKQGGPAHSPFFSFSVTVADLKFTGHGHSKREARAAAARACLRDLLRRAGQTIPELPEQDFTSDDPDCGPGVSYVELKDDPVVAESINLIRKDKILPQSTVTKTGSPAVTTPTVELFRANPGLGQPVNKSPINILYEKYPGLSFTCSYGDGEPLESTQAPTQYTHCMRFKVVCTIKDQKFEGYGSSKKLAKLSAARAALATLEESTETIPTNLPVLSNRLAHIISNLVNEKFDELTRGDFVQARRKVLAGIVITVEENDTETAKLIAVTTGTKCVSGEHISVIGLAVNDCHAEVVARRCLQRHLYSQLLMYARSDDPTKTLVDSDLEPVSGGGYQLKASRRVHLYVSTAPCGDGRIFSPHDELDCMPDKHPNRLARGQLRTKIESGEGTIPVKNSNNVLQTWDGVLQGERLLTMSCSDKVARWCVVGLQGALLSRLMRPVYLDSIVLGSLLNPQHMYRAIGGRISPYLSPGPPPFRQAHPLLARSSSTEPRTPARAPNISVCWCATNPKAPEVLNAITGKLENGQPSLLCKQSMFARWQYLVRRLPLLPQDEKEFYNETYPPQNYESILYSEAKLMSTGYQIAKGRLFKAFSLARLGQWIKKPMEQDQFVCEIKNAPLDAMFA